MKHSIVVLLAVFTTAFALQGQTQYKCTVADVQGPFAVQPQGILTTGPYAGPFSATGIINFDGNGGFTGIATSNFNGHVIYPFGATGTYTVTPDCIVTTLELTLRISFRGFLSATKNEILFLGPDQGSITTNLTRRVTKTSCTNADLVDNWAISAVGVNVITGNHIAQNGRLTFDGFGNFTGATYSGIGGAQTSSVVAGTYTVSNDCTFQGREVDTYGNVSHFFGVLFTDSELIFVYSDNGAVIPGQGRQSVK